MDWTFLRDNLYLDVFPYLVGEDGVIRGPAGDGMVAAVTRDDIAAAAAEMLSRPGAHVGSTYVLTGPEATHADPDRRDHRARPGARGHLPRRDRRGGLRVTPASGQAPDWQNDAWVSTYTAIAAGEMAEVTDHVLRLTGRRPMSLAVLARAPARTSR